MTRIREEEEEEEDYASSRNDGLPCHTWSQLNCFRMVDAYVQTYIYIGSDICECVNSRPWIV